MIKGFEPPIQAIKDWVIIEPVNRIEGMQDGIVIPESAKESLKADSEPAIIISVGEDCSGHLAPGKTAYVLLGSCLTLPLIGGKSLLMCKDSRIAGVLP